MKKNIFAMGLLGVLLFGIATGASGLTIDFTAPEWIGVEGQLTYTKTVFGIDVTLDGNGGVLTYNANDPGGLISIPPLFGDGDGIGIIDDEVSQTELLTISFSQSIRATDLYLLDAFGSSSEQEAAEISIDGGLFEAVAGLGNPYGFVEIDLTTFASFSGAFSSLTFRTLSDGGISDYSVAGLEFSPANEVPEPATMLLFGAGLTGLAAFRNRRKAIK